MLDLDKISGLITEAFGAGNLDELTSWLMIAAGHQLLWSLAVQRIAEPVYAYEWCPAAPGWYLLRQRAVPKARIKLLIALNCWTQGQELRDYTEG